MKLLPIWIVLAYLSVLFGGCSSRYESSEDMHVKAYVLSKPHPIERIHGKIVDIESVDDSDSLKKMVVTFQPEKASEVVRVTVLAIPEKLRSAVIGKRATYTISLNQDDLALSGLDASNIIREFRDAFQEISKN